MSKKTSLPKLAKKALTALFSKPATSNYPVEKPELSENYRGEPFFDPSLCVGCGLCSVECPSKAIELVDVEGKKKAAVHLDKCIFCYRCVEVCPKKAIQKSKLYELATTDKSTLYISPETSTKEKP